MEAIGWFGSLCFSICAIPQCVKVYSSKSTSSLSWLFLLLWSSGALFSLVYLILSNVKVGAYQLPLLANYALTFAQTVYLVCAKLYYEKEKK